MSPRADLRRPVTDPRVRVLTGLGTAGVLIAADAWLSGIHPGRFISTAVMVPLGYWLLTPVAELSARRPAKAGLLAGLFGAGLGSIWWALSSVAYSIWVMLSIGRCVALLSLAPVDARQRVPQPTASAGQDEL